MKLSRIMAIDPSKYVLHCACWCPGPRVPVVFIDIPSIPENIAATLNVVRMMGVKSILYEDCYKGRNVKTYAEAFALRDRVKEVAFGIKMPIEIKSPSTWQAKILRMPSDSGKLKRDELKRRSILLAEHTLRYRVLSSDTADAFCMLLYASGILIQSTLKEALYGKASI